MITALVIDWETTGLPLHPEAPLAKQPRVIEFGGALVRSDGAVLEEASLLINPRQPLEPIITKITGLTDADLADQPEFSAAWPEIEALMRKADVLVAHNLPFDRFMLELELRRAGAEAPWPKDALCTVQLYRPLWGRRPKLLELYESVTGQPLAQTHRALDDVRALVEIVRKERLLDYYDVAAAAVQN